MGPKWQDKSGESVMRKVQKHCNYFQGVEIRRSKRPDTAAGDLIRDSIVQEFPRRHANANGTVADALM